MKIKIIKEKISQQEIRELALETFGNMAKAVVDIERGVMAVGGEMHVDGEALLIKDGSKQQDIWGINIYPDRGQDKWIEYSSLINIRPSAGNRSMEIEDLDVRDKIKQIVENIIE